MQDSIVAQECVAATPGDHVIQKAHVLTNAHRAIKGAVGADREVKKDARKVAEKKLFSACDEHKRKAQS